MIEPGFVADAPSAFVDFRQIGIEVAGVPFAGRHVALGRSDLAERFSIVRHVGHNHEDVQIEIESEVLRYGKRGARQDETFDGGFVGEIEEHHNLAEHAAVGESFAEKTRIGVGHAHRGEHHGEVGFPAWQPGLTHDLRGETVVRQARAGKNRQLLPTHQDVETIHRRQPGLYEFARVGARGRVDWRAVDVAL